MHYRVRTNWAAIVILLDKIPLIYGLGVILRQFDYFKLAIEDMLLSQFFNIKYIDQLFVSSLSTSHSIE